MFEFLRYRIRHLEYIKSVKNYLKFIEKEKELELNASPEDNKTNVWEVTIYDVLTNKELNKLVEALHRLDKYKYQTKINFRKKKFKDLQYLGIEVNSTTIGNLAEITFIDHKYFKKLSLGYTQITNQTIAIEYDFTFNKPWDTDMKNQFIRDNIKSTYFLNYTSIAYNFIFEKKDYGSIQQLEHDYVNDIFQAFIVKNLYSKLGKSYTLPIIYKAKYEKGEEEELELKNPFLMTSMYHTSEDYYVLNDVTAERNTFYLYFNKNYIPNIPFLSYFQYFGNEFYYNIFNGIEVKELDRKITKYLLENYKVVKKKDYQWLVNKLRALKDSDFKPIIKSNLKMIDVWEVRWDGKIENESFFTGDILTKKYTKIYSDYHDYMKTLFTMQNDSIILTVGLLTLFFTLAGVILAII